MVIFYFRIYIKYRWGCNIFGIDDGLKFMGYRIVSVSV